MSSTRHFFPGRGSFITFTSTLAMRRLSFSCTCGGVEGQHGFAKVVQLLLLCVGAGYSSCFETPVNCQAAFLYAGVEGQRGPASGGLLMWGSVCGLRQLAPSPSLVLNEAAHIILHVTCLHLRALPSDLGCYRPTTPCVIHG